MLLGGTILINTKILLVILAIVDADVSNRHTHRRVASSVDFALNTFK